MFGEVEEQSATSSREIGGIRQALVRRMGVVRYVEGFY
jgi:hypothetical protein